MARWGETIYERKDGQFKGRYIKEYESNGKGKTEFVFEKIYQETKEKLILSAEKQSRAK